MKKNYNSLIYSQVNTTFLRKVIIFSSFESWDVFITSGNWDNVQILAFFSGKMISFWKQLFNDREIYLTVAHYHLHCKNFYYVRFSNDNILGRVTWTIKAMYFNSDINVTKMLPKISFKSEVYIGISPSFMNTVSVQWTLFWWNNYAK